MLINIQQSISKDISSDGKRQAAYATVITASITEISKKYPQFTAAFTETFNASTFTPVVNMLAIAEKLYKEALKTIGNDLPKLERPDSILPGFLYKYPANSCTHIMKENAAKSLKPQARPYYFSFDYINLSSKSIFQAKCDFNTGGWMIIAKISSGNSVSGQQ